MYIFLWPGLASCRCRPLSSNVRPHIAVPLPLDMTSTPNIETLIATLDKDIEESRKSAKQFLELFYIALGAAAVFLFLYIAPEVAAGKLPAAEAVSRDGIRSFNLQIQQWEKKYSRKIEFMNEDQYKAKEKSGSLTPYEIEARKITYPNDSIFFEKILRILSRFQVDGSKLETMMKVIPLFISALCAGFLLTYRFHAQAAIDLVKEKYKILAESSRSGA